MELKTFEWSEELNTGISEIDEQHKKLVGLINKLTSALLKQSEENVIEYIFDELVDYTKYHFGQEEEIFECIGYSQRNEHEKSHVEFVSKIRSFDAKHLSGAPNIARELNRYLVEWLFKHIVVADMMYVGEFKRSIAEKA